MSITRKKFTTTVGNRELSLEVSSLAPQANSAVLAKYGETVALVTVVMGDEDSSADYLPLKVEYEERFYAAGKIIGSRFVRREGRPSEEAVLSGRLIDRTIRPLFDYHIRRDIQVVTTILAIDEENDPEFVSLFGASAALMISSVPFNGPVGGIRIAKIAGEFVVNPTATQIASPDCEFETFASGPRDLINMIELGGKDASESDVAQAFALAQSEINKIINFQETIQKEIGKSKADIIPAPIDARVISAANDFLADKLSTAIYVADKTEQGKRLKQLEAELNESLTEKFAPAADPGSESSEEELPKITSRVVSDIMEDAIDRAVHAGVLDSDHRPDGRAIDQIRDLSAEVRLFERTHGSAVFVRGTTQALAVATLAAPGQEQLIETMETTGKRRFLLHYNFPPYSVGEIGRFGSPGRREIGHGALARKALESVIPPREEFPYTIRVVSETLSSNGSSSMATTCASTMALMDAGVPLRKPVAGIAMGLMSNPAQGVYKVLTDLQGPEDFYGDMDFKVAGTDQGITAIQLDTKISGLPHEVIVETLNRAKSARLKILDVIKSAIPAPCAEISKYAPAVFQLTIPVDKIGLLIGPGGKMINGLIEKYSLQTIDVEDDGSVFIAGQDRVKTEQAVADIKALTREIKAGEIVEGTVIKILEFGAIVDLGGGQDGMIHVSELKDGFTKSVREVLKEGDFVRVKVIRVEADGKIGLSLKQMSAA